MKKADSSHLEALEALLAEKRKHEGYLEKLELRKAGTPEHVYARLRDEYLTKLTDAQVRAAAEAESLSGGLQDDAVAVQEAEGKLSALEEERIEGELRAEVGEFDPKDWQKKLTALNASIALAEKERDVRREVFERTRTLLAEARGKLEGGEQGAAIEPAPEGPSAPETATRPQLRHTTAIKGAPNFDELEFLKSVVGRQSTPSKPIVEGGSAPAPKPLSDGPSAPTPRSTPANVAAAPAATSASAGAAHEARPAEAPAPRASQPVAAPADDEAAQDEEESAASKPEASRSAAPSEPEAKPARKPAAKAEPAEDEEDSAPSPLGKPNPRNSQTIKSLKCQECGSMNYPTEWYCERCGGELAAL
ncbi:MAG: hypothetical protein KF709_13940 [Gemmatimonadaceae bacterium]|nr:hypothetical protein [Gemmatimonadaceae bacterium]